MFGGIFKKIGKFFKDILSFIKLVINFVKFVWTFLKALVEVVSFLFTDFPKNFFKTIIPAILYLWVMFVMMITKIELFGVPLGAIWLGLVCWIITTAVGIIKIGLFLVQELIGLSLILIIAFIEIILPGMAFSRLIYRYFMANETHPMSWFTTSGSHSQNVTQRLFPSIFVFRPCTEGYIPSSIVPYVCEKVPSYIPSRCPTAIVKYAYAIKKNPKGVLEPNKIQVKATQNPLSYVTSLLSTSDYTLYADHINEYYTTCNDAMTAYKPISKAICRGALSNPNLKLSQMCYNEHCRNGYFEPFCMQSERNIAQSLSVDNLLYELGWDNDMVVAKTCTIALIACLMGVVGLIVFENRDQQ